MDAPILLRRLGENLCFILWRGEPGGRTCAVKIEHDLRCARLAGKQINPANFTCAQPASNAAAATDKINAEFFISENAELLGEDLTLVLQQGDFARKIG
jgi:hypothetical protein